MLTIAKFEFFIDMFSYNIHKYLLPFVVRSPNIRVNLVNKSNNVFDALMFNDNDKTIGLLVYDCHFSN